MLALPCDARARPPSRAGTSFGILTPDRRKSMGLSRADSTNLTLCLARDAPNNGEGYMCDSTRAAMRRRCFAGDQSKKGVPHADRVAASLLPAIGALASAGCRGLRCFRGLDRDRR